MHITKGAAVLSRHNWKMVSHPATS